MTVTEPSRYQYLEERFLAYSSLCSPSEKLFVTWCRTDFGGAEALILDYWSGDGSQYEDDDDLAWISGAYNVSLTDRQIQQLIDLCRSLEGLDADAPDYGKRMARVLVLFAYVKRKMNFVLMAAERETVSAEELALALEESVRFLALCGLETSVERKTDRDFSHREAVALYDSFEILTECLLDRTPAILVSLAGDALRILAECAPPSPLPETPAAVEAEYEGGQLYLALTARKEADDERAP